jgi:hypothetical protein
MPLVEPVTNAVLNYKCRFIVCLLLGVEFAPLN